MLQGLDSNSANTSSESEVIIPTDEQGLEEKQNPQVSPLSPTFYGRRKRDKILSAYRKTRQGALQYTIHTELEEIHTEECRILNMLRIPS
jgi:hypothetical protein